MRQMTTEFEEELDFGMVSSGSGNLARKADIRQYPERAARSRSAHNTYSRESQHDSGMYTQMSYRQAEHGQMVRTRSQEPVYYTHLDVYKRQVTGRYSRMHRPPKEERLAFRYPLLSV